jgi:hypothetical protein
MAVEPLGEGFGEPVGERLEEDVGIIVILGLEAGEMRLDAVDGDREAADPVLAVGIDEIGEAHIGAPFPLLHLLAEHRQAGLVIAGEHETSSPSRRQRHRPTVPRGGQPMLGDDPVEHRLGVGEQARGALADHRILEDRVVAPPISSGSVEALRSISRATCTISSSDGVIRPDRPMMSAFSALAVVEDLRRRHHHAEVDHLVVVAPSTTPTMFLPMSWTSPLTVAITILPCARAAPPARAASPPP